MVPLVAASLLWALAPGLLKHELAGVPSTAVSVLRLALTALVFAPALVASLAARTVSTSTALRLLAIGAVQFGLMYLLYLRAFAHLQAHEVFLFTALTPFFVVLLDGALARRVAARDLGAAALATASAAVVLWRDAGIDDAVVGFFLVQGANLCFALGQIAYRRVRPTVSASEPQVFSWQALGGVLATVLVVTALPTSATTWTWTSLPSLFTARQACVLVFLGVVCSGFGFFLWNLGQARVRAGVLAALNNAKVPLGVAVSLAVFGEDVAPVRLVVSLALLLSAVVVGAAGRGARD